MNVALRPLREEDAETSIHWRQDPEIWRYTLAAGRPPPTIEDERDWIRKVIADPNERRFAILADGVYVGNVYLTGIADATAEFHIVIGDKSYWGRGLATKATEEAIELAREVHGIRQLSLSVHEENDVAFRMYQRLGFKTTSKEGHFWRMIKCLESNPSML